MNYEARRGFIGEESRDLSWDGVLIGSLQNEAEKLLLARYDAVPQRYSRRRWDRLGQEGQQAASEELYRMVALAENRNLQPHNLVDAGLSSFAYGVLTDSARQYRESLPFAPAESRWMMGEAFDARFDAPFMKGRRPSELDALGAVELIMSQRGEIVSGGRQAVADGEELINREWDWMRGRGGFRHGSTYEVVTRNALRRLANLIDQDTPQREVARQKGFEL